MSRICAEFSSNIAHPMLAQTGEGVDSPIVRDKSAKRAGKQGGVKRLERAEKKHEYVWETYALVCVEQ